LLNAPGRNIDYQWTVMSDQRSPNHGSHPGGPRALSEQEVARLWQEFRAGNVAYCPRDDAPLALAVDGSAKSYRLVCTRCGNASLWFEVGPGGVRVRNLDDAVEPGLSDD
jgi:hypothetical protein